MKEKKQSIIMTAGAIFLIFIILAGYWIVSKIDNEDEKEQNEFFEMEMAGEEVSSGEQMTEQEDTAAREDYPTFTPEEAYDYSFMNQSAEALYEEVFSTAKQQTEYVHFYIEEGILYLDEYAQTDRQDKNGVYIYEWHNKQKIAEEVIFVDYNWYRVQPDALYITEDHVLYGTGAYEDIHLENIRFASTYADQMLALTLDGNLWCRGISYSIGDGRVLEYQGWELVMENVVFAQLAHYRYMAITNDGSLYMWGDNTLGQFGDGSLLKDGSTFTADTYFFEQPVKVADDIKMVWEGHPGNPRQTEEFGELRTYFLTEDNELLVSGELVGDEVRSYTYFGELGALEEPLQVNCTSTLHRVVTE